VQNITLETSTSTPTNPHWEFMEDGYPMTATFPIAGGTCSIRFLVNWHLTEKGWVEICSLEPQHPVNGIVWAAFLVWAEGQKPEWTRWLDGIIEDLRMAQHDDMMRQW
jgi:hypothetical protein